MSHENRVDLQVGAMSRFQVALRVRTKESMEGDEEPPVQV